MKLLKNYSFLYALAGLASLAYLWFVWQTPIITTSEALLTYTTKIKFVRFALSFGYIVSWFAAAYAVTHLAKYHQLIQKSEEGKGFGSILFGLFALALGMMAWPPMTAVRALFTNSPELIQLLTYFFNYLMVVPTLAGFFLMHKGAAEILVATGIKARFRLYNLWWFGALALFAGLYLWLLFTNPQRRVAPAPGVPATFYLSDPLIIATIVLPSLASWLLGILAALKINTFKHQVQGLIYKSALPAFSAGITSIVIGSAALQAIVSVGTNKLFQLGPAPLVLTVYAFAGMLAVGYILLARSAKRLTTIEKV